MLRALTAATSTVLVGAPWVLRVHFDDLLEDPYIGMPVFTVTDPIGDVDVVPGVQHATYSGIYYATYVPDQLGRHIARIDAGVAGLVAVTADVVEVTANGELPDVVDVVAYMGGDEAVSWSDEEISRDLEQEKAAQTRRCRIPAAYPADLAGALLRRTQRALAMRALGLAVRDSADGEGAAIVVPGNDPEVRRLEAPYRKLVIG